MKINHGRTEQIDNSFRTAEPLSATELLVQRKFEATGTSSTLLATITEP